MAGSRARVLSTPSPCAVRRGGGRKLTLDVSGKADRLKQFLRWCYRGPPLVGSPAKVTVKWSKA